VIYSSQILDLEHVDDSNFVCNMLMDLMIFRLLRASIMGLYVYSNCSPYLEMA
jgi:hypothetical protein